MQTYCQKFNWTGCKSHLIESGCKKSAFYWSGSVHEKQILAFSFDSNSTACSDSNIEIGRFGYLSYDLKSKLTDLKSGNSSRFNWPDYHFFDAQCMVIIENETLEFFGDKFLFEKHVAPFMDKEPQIVNNNEDPVELIPGILQEDYVKRIDEIKQNLQKGEAYEINFCQDFWADAVIDPIGVAFKLFEITKAPFSAVLQIDGEWILSGSPERFLKKTGRRLVSQPIKGTAKRGQTASQDKKIIEELLINEKERSENIMIVDLVRNDLSKVSKSESVQVDELCQLYSFNTVHQLISTVSCELKDGVRFMDVLKACFPMGSMTGAPKYRVMELIEELEDFKRGAYSGSVGYILPNGDFDFNVVIRSIIYDEKIKRISVPVGGAITIESDAQAEYEECLLKLNAMQKALL